MFNYKNNGIATKFWIENNGIQITYISKLSGDFFNKLDVIVSVDYCWNSTVIFISFNGNFYYGGVPFEKLCVCNKPDWPIVKPFVIRAVISWKPLSKNITCPNTSQLLKK